MNNNKEFKIRASANGQIMGVRGLGKTGQNYIEKWIMSNIFNRSFEIKNKFLDKGNICENESIQFAAKILGIELFKNEQYFENDFFTGTPDIIYNKECVIDMKNSWSWETFPLLENDITNSDYYGQLQVYMNLTGIKKAKLIYTMLDTPEHLIEKEAWYYCKSLGLEELDIDIFEEFQAKMTYPDIEEKNKIKIFDIDYDPKFIEKLESRVLMCRQIIENEILPNLK